MASTLQLKLSCPPSAMQSSISYRRPHRTWSAIQRMLGRVRQQWKLLGFFEINEQHEYFKFTCMLKEGLKASIQKTIDEPVSMESQKPSDFQRVLKQMHEGYEMRTYAAPVFARFRQYLGMMDTDFQKSLTCESSYLQFISNSKSKADFFLTFDKRYFLKTQRKREIRFLLTNLSKYLDHLERYPHSILVKFLGVYSIIAPQEKKRYFIIMQSVFYPHEKINERYDIKGCQVGRWTEPTVDSSEVIVVFKDCDFGGKVITINQEQTWLLQQVKLDTQFLKALHVIDYSLLVGLQPLHDDDQFLDNTLGNILARTRLSLSCEYPRRNIPRVSSNTSSSSSSSYEHILRLYPDYLSPYLRPDRPPEQLIRSEGFMRNVVTPFLMQNSYEDMSCIVGSALHSSIPSDLTNESFAAQHRRMLPASKNPLHTIDGPDYRYYVGIIDLFTVFTFRKKLECLWKSIRYRGQQFSTVEPSYYAQRLCQWVESHTI
ncbi:phosphatidylinositol 4-phosphate 5-kinase-like protein 1 isoform X2 [Pantherophis guttatus]|uniref:Phosphatidylinositol 4-phosphate 5-kinase-like protein 1 isoform X2 n=1 Tax=Pantherophis guttatus TaxID=94885 RepID=A0ABM3YVB3_PANGU|nr:phosphatidylinositol 4-phosphate 5-kinase-like protein 1 isoform X2 [Pantherophis guttatus]